MSSPSSIPDNDSLNISIRAGLRDLFQALSPRRRREFHRLLALMIACGVTELATIGAVLPFLSLLANPGSVDDGGWIAVALNALGPSSERNRLLAVTAIFVVTVVVAGLARLALAWSNQAFASAVAHDLAVEIQRRVLLQPYTFHIGGNSSSLIAALEKVPVLVFNVIQQAMQATAAGFIAILIVGALIYVAPLTAVASAGAFGLAYVFVSVGVRRRLKISSAAFASSYDQRVKLVQESLGSIRDILIDGSQQVFVDEFRRIDGQFNSARASIGIIAAAPRFTIEALGTVLIAVIAVVLSTRQGEFAGALPILGTLVLGAQRLLPLLQQTYTGWSLASGHRSVMGEVLELLNLPGTPEVEQVRAVEPLRVRERITLNHVSFAYPGGRGRALDDVSLLIQRGAWVAVVGRTGSGKSTLVDLLMGLLEPDDGTISIDGIPLTPTNRRRWQRSIAHVPQAIFLADTSIARNIAFGVPTDAIDLSRVVDAARRAQLEDFVAALPDGYQTLVGERGIRLSGGQRQRLGIARAIYKQAPVMFLDEATSALDDATEATVLRAIKTLADQGCTIISIAHRRSTIAGANLVVQLENGRVVDIRPG